MKAYWKALGLILGVWATLGGVATGFTLLVMWVRGTFGVGAASAFVIVSLLVVFSALLAIPLSLDLRKGAHGDE